MTMLPILIQPSDVPTQSPLAKDYVAAPPSPEGLTFAELLEGVPPLTEPDIAPEGIVPPIEEGTVDAEPGLEGEMPVPETATSEGAEHAQKAGLGHAVVEPQPTAPAWEARSDPPQDRHGHVERPAQPARPDGAEARPALAGSPWPAARLESGSTALPISAVAQLTPLPNHGDHLPIADQTGGAKPSSDASGPRPIGVISPEGEPRQMTPLTPVHLAARAAPDGVTRVEVGPDQTTRRRLPDVSALSPLPSTPPKPAVLQGFAKPGPTLVQTALPNSPHAVSDPKAQTFAPDGMEFAQTARSAEGAPSTPTPPATATQAARPVVAQILHALPHPGQSVVEIAMHPEELGRVRMALSATDGLLTLTLSAERAETMELLRRHSGELGQHYLALGYSGVDVQFQQNTPDEQEAPPKPDTSPKTDIAEDGPPIATHDAPLISVRSGLDIRL